ncbi:Mariner Mos1 transposase [Eumeta japonica]|uniref:Mariner Mos1 transposase n=1 Tax=Eumeta variegata TaxID=151549 RepID=A0A4C1ZI23_EUMVA|nr:Mariner Mos1 transposase [Eumeta japonica]
MSHERLDRTSTYHIVRAQAPIRASLNKEGIMLLKAHRLLVEAYNEVALNERACREWFQKFKNGGFNVKDKDRSVTPKINEDAELEELLEEDSSQTQKKLALTLEVAQQAVSLR